jgi:hypothetical protein
MSFIDDKLIRYAWHLAGQGYDVELYPRLEGADRDVEAFDGSLHLRATRGLERKLFRFENFDSDEVRALKHHYFNAFLGKFSKGTLRDLLHAANQAETGRPLPDTPANKNITLNFSLVKKNGIYVKRRVLHDVDVPAPIVRDKWYDASVAAVEKQVQYAAAYLPLAVQSDRQAYFFGRGRQFVREPKRYYNTRTKQKEPRPRDQREYEQQAVQQGIERYWSTYQASAHLLMYNGHEDVVKPALIRILASELAIPLHVYWNDRKATLYPPTVQFEQESILARKAR